MRLFLLFIFEYIVVDLNVDGLTIKTTEDYRHFHSEFLVEIGALMDHKL